jgi:hypothetical protein
MQYRNGDVMIEKVKVLPKDAKKQQHVTLAEGELTGHSHRIEEKGSAVMFKDRGVLFLEVTAKVASLVHEEHATIQLPKGIYRVWQQREYTPERIVTVRD